MKSTDPAARMGVFKRLEDVPPERRLHQHTARYTDRDSWASFLEDAHFDRVTADRGRRDAERTGEQWKSHMAHQDRHHALALPKDVNRTWRQYFHPEYAETEDYREVTSHYGRHYFSSYWRLKDRASRKQVQYMRGDVLGGKDEADRGKESVDTYLHGHYHEIEDLYRDEIFKLRI